MLTLKIKLAVKFRELGITFYTWRKEWRFAVPPGGEALARQLAEKVRYGAHGVTLSVEAAEVAA